MRHDWKGAGSVQWSAMGLPQSAAASYYECARCGAEFTHHYNAEPSIYKAMEAEGHTMDSCPEPDAS